MKRFIALLLVCCSLPTLCACGKEETPARDISGSRGEAMIDNSLYPEGTDIQSLYDNLYRTKTLRDYLEECEAAVKVEIVEIENKNEFSVRYICRVDEDYFGNVNYYGMEETHISVYDSKMNYSVGDEAYMFLTAENIKGYKHIAYLQLPDTAGFIDTKIVNGKVVPVIEIYSAVSEDNVYCLEKRQKPEKEIMKYAKNNSKAMIFEELTDGE